MVGKVHTNKSHEILIPIPPQTQQLGGGNSSGGGGY